jgi:hypothetical protein
LLEAGITTYSDIIPECWTERIDPIRFNRVDACDTCYKKKRFGIQIASKGSIREDTVKIGWYREKQRPFLPAYSAKRQFIRMGIGLFLC